MESNFVDYVKIICRSGKGGRGSMHMHRAKYAPMAVPMVAMADVEVMSSSGEITTIGPSCT